MMAAKLVVWTDTRRVDKRAALMVVVWAFEMVASTVAGLVVPMAAM